MYFSLNGIHKYRKKVVDSLLCIVDYCISMLGSNVDKKSSEKFIKNNEQGLFRFSTIQLYKTFKHLILERFNQILESSFNSATYCIIKCL